MSEKPQETRTVQTKTLVLYTTESGGKYHRDAACATGAFKNPYIDGGDDLFSRLEMSRYGDVDPDDDQLCDNCADPIVKRVDQ